MFSLLGVLGCIWVDQTEYNDMRDQLLDFDSDGFQTQAEGGTDCDDTDPAVYPGAQETWYDGVDSDCGGDDDYDRDADGAAAQAYGGTDCDDGNDAIGPHATEVWYDGIDQNCDGGNDYDADGDGYTSAEHDGDDCDDTEPTAYPGATEVWYDGIDGDCLGDDDHDADGDGYPMGDQPGDDCDDTDPDRNPLNLETMGDDLDADCDGGLDSFGLPHTSTMDVTGFQGPIVRMSDREISVGYAAEEIVDPSDGYTVYDALSVVSFAPNGFADGPTLDYPYGFSGSSGSMGEAMDFWSDGSHYFWASSLHRTSPTERRVLYLDAIDFTRPANDDTAGMNISDVQFDDPYSSIDLFVDDDGGLTMVACEGTFGTTSVIQDHVDEFVPDALPSLQLTSDDPFQLCEVASGTPDSPQFWTTRDGVAGAGVATVDEGALVDGGALDLGELEIASWTLVDWEVEVFHSVIWTMVVDAAEGIYLWDGAEVDWLVPDGESYLRADIGADAQGNAYVCAVTDSGALRFWVGPLGELVELTMETGLTTVEQCSVGASATGLVVLAVRGDDQLIIGGARNPSE